MAHLVAVKPSQKVHISHTTESNLTWSALEDPIAKLPGGAAPPGVMKDQVCG